MCGYVHISSNSSPEFPSAALASLNDALCSPRSVALQAKNLFGANLTENEKVSTLGRNFTSHPDIVEPGFV